MEKTAHGYKHGESKTRLFRIWAHMRQRCMNQNDQRYSDYGGRGIIVSEEWDDYLNFKKWAMNNGYNEKLTIDRINNDGNYEPSNCKWSTNKEQCNNRRSNRNITVDGITKNEKEWGEFLGVESYIIRVRIHRGMNEIEAVTKPIRVNRNGKYIEYDYYAKAKARLDREKAQVNMTELLQEQQTEQLTF